MEFKHKRIIIALVMFAFLFAISLPFAGMNYALVIAGGGSGLGLLSALSQDWIVNRRRGNNVIR